MNRLFLLTCLGCSLLEASVLSAESRTAPLLNLAAAMRQHMGIATAQLESHQPAAQLKAYGEVLDPSPLLSQMRELQRARLQAEQAMREARRADDLAQAGQLASARKVENARLQAATAQLQVQAAEEALRLNWGWSDDLQSMEQIAAALRQGEAMLVRLSLPLGTSMAPNPDAATLWAAGQKAAPVEVQTLWRAPQANAQGAPGYVAIAPAGPDAMPVGLRLLAALNLPEATAAQLQVPDTAVVYQLGAAWVYQEENEGQFRRHLISTDLPAPEGWYVPAKALDEAQPVVVSGAQALLAQEILTQMGEPEGQE
ncbi:MAG: hypothetical protein E1N59_2062 [Puniceicoccaceae bacterium 5H]|nr:MAG: hypothetical protein E1N59_2062 [Puniceicoccaceae bacterium 5H]